VHVNAGKHLVKRTDAHKVLLEEETFGVRSSLLKSSAKAKFLKILKIVRRND
jgi:hypothetical protein